MRKKFLTHDLPKGITVVKMIFYPNIYSQYGVKYVKKFFFQARSIFHTHIKKNGVTNVAREFNWNEISNKKIFLGLRESSLCNQLEFLQIHSLMWENVTQNLIFLLQFIFYIKKRRNPTLNYQKIFKLEEIFNEKSHSSPTQCIHQNDPRIN